MDFISQVRSTIAEHNMIVPGDAVLVGVSGGPDSLALLHMLNRLKDELQFKLYIGHLNHMFRGEEAAADSRQVESLSRNWGIPLITRSVNVPEYIAERNLSAQVGAREVRYVFFRETAAKVGANRVALGHHADDVAETVLLNLIRGSGLSGLSGIPPVREGIYIRPFLKVRRKQIELYCRLFNIPYRTDTSNLKTIYLRNKVRLELIPILEEGYNPGLVKALNRMAEIIRDEDHYMDCVAAAALKDVIDPSEKGKIIISLKKLNCFSDAVKRRILRLAYRHLAGYLKTPTFDHIDKALELIAGKPDHGEMDFPGGILLIKRYNFLEIINSRDNRDNRQVPFYQYFLKIPGDTHIPEVNRMIKSEVLDVAQTMDPRLFCFSETVLDMEKLRGPLYVRRPSSGDVFSPLGMNGKMKIKKFFIELKVPREERDAIPIVTCGNDIVWVAGFRPGEPWKVTSSTKTCLHLVLVKEKHSIQKSY